MSSRPHGVSRRLRLQKGRQPLRVLVLEELVGYLHEVQSVHDVFDARHRLLDAVVCGERGGARESGDCAGQGTAGRPSSYL